MSHYTRRYGFLLYILAVLVLLCLLPQNAFDPISDLFLLSIGFLAAWRYSWMGIHYLRAFIYLKFKFPAWRRSLGTVIMPSKLYILATFYRIAPSIAAQSLHAILHEALAMTCPVMITLSIVEAQDEEMALHVISQYTLPDTLKIHIIRAKGKGKRHGLAQGLRVISQDMPDEAALCVLMDGDTILTPESVRKCVGFFRTMPGLGACTTDEIASVKGMSWMQDWHDLRFAQRHLLMSSLSLSKRVMTLTGRMSVFRASIAVEPGFIRCIESDYLEHWRFGKMPLLTGDDKSSLFYVMQKGYEQIYIPDVQVVTLEQPLTDNFFTSTTLLMRRWFGNMLRTNERLLGLGPIRMPFFVWWSFLDQRISMWTTFCGPVFAFMLSLRYGPIFFLYYFAWVGVMRGLVCILLYAAHHRISWRYPFLLYYNQIYGALLKIWVMFHSYRQSWTKQNIQTGRSPHLYIRLWDKCSSGLIYMTSILFLVTIIGLASDIVHLPDIFE